MNIYIYPTDTVWGIGASIYDRKANLRISEIKKTPAIKPVSVLMASLEEVQAYFKLPVSTNLELLKEIFRLEATLGFPSAWLQKEIPDYIFAGSTWVGVRCLELAGVQRLMQKVAGPVTTTSLNYTGEVPITSQTLAVEFAQKIKGCMVIPSLPTDPPMSGHASTLISFNEKGAYELIRAGRYSERLQDSGKRVF